jgi:hypothetical protein
VGALGHNHDQRAAAIGHEAALQKAERVGDQREFSTSSTVIGAVKVARGFFAAHSRYTTDTSCP